MNKTSAKSSLIIVIVISALAIGLFWAFHSKLEHNSYQDIKQDENTLSKSEHTKKPKTADAQPGTIKSTQESSFAANSLQNQRPQQTEGKQAATVVENFERLRQCHSSFAKIRNLKGRMDACTLAAQHEGGYDEVCKRQQIELDAKIRVEEANLAYCGAVPAQVELDYYTSVEAAAKLGDADAQICYIRGNFDVGSGLSKQTIAQYQQTSQEYVNQAIKRGDWRAVALLGLTENNLAHTGGLISSLAIGDPITVYKMNRLLLLGAEGDYAGILATRLKTYALRLTSGQIAQANAWAKAYYDQYFASKPKLISPPEPCVDAP